MTTHLVAVDPGARHVGVAKWSKAQGLTSTEIENERAAAAIRRLLSRDVVLVMEEFRLYPSASSALRYSEMTTSELIGALKYIADEEGARVVMQPAAIKESTRRQCVARRLEWRDPASGHASDARLHALYYLLRSGLIEGSR